MSLLFKFFLLNLFCVTLLANTISLVGKKLPDVTLRGDDGGNLKFTAWESSTLKSKVHVLFYIDPDRRDVNQALQDAIEAEKFDLQFYQTVAVINMAATWAPDGLIEINLKQKQERYPRVEYIRDKKKVLVKKMGLMDDEYVTLIVDPSSKVIFHENGVFTPEKIAEFISIVKAEISKLNPVPTTTESAAPAVPVDSKPAANPVVTKAVPTTKS